MHYEVKGTSMPTLDVVLQPGEAILTEKGGLAWMSGDISMDTRAIDWVPRDGRPSSEDASLFMTIWRCNSGRALITFAPQIPAAIMAIDLADGATLICQKGAFLCAQDSVQIEIHLRQKLSSGLFGDQGFILHEISGPGTAFVEIAGEVREYALQSGQSMHVDPGHIAMFESTVQCELEQVKDTQSTSPGREGLLLVRLGGPGRIWLHSMSLAGLAATTGALGP